MSYIINPYLLEHEAQEQRRATLAQARRDQLLHTVRQEEVTQMKLTQTKRKHNLLFPFIFLLLALSASTVLFAQATAWAAPAEEDTPAAQLFLPLVTNGQATVTVTPTPVTPTATPTATASVTPSPEVTETPAGNVVNSFFVETEWKTSSGDIVVDSSGGMHVAHAYYEAAGGSAPVGSVYLHCASQCEEGANWHSVHFPQQVDEVQLQLTANGLPRLLMHGTDSAVQTGGHDYYYAECNANCDLPENWTNTIIVTSYGTDIFDVNADTLPQRYFALDPAGHPRFLYLDRNYPIEPDHYGFYYVACDAGCANAANWTQTLVTDIKQEEYVFDWEVAQDASITFTSSGQPRFIAELMLMDQDRTTALYYFACDSGCDSRANWGRVKIGERGQGSDLSWDLVLDANGRPRVAHYPASLPDDKGERLYYVWCDSDCLTESNWQRVDLGLPAEDGQEPDIELDANGHPRIAHADASTGGLGYSWCNGECGVASNWQHVVVESAQDLYQLWPVPYPLTCDAGFWDGLTPTLSLSAAGNPYIAYDATYHARCLYQDPNYPNDPPYYRFHLVMRSVRGVYFNQP
ncbi:MAG: hypothetical protein R3C14_11390 [Caldilineaceae bacterium]